MKENRIKFPFTHHCGFNTRWNITAKIRRSQKLRTQEKCRRHKQCLLELWENSSLGGAGGASLILRRSRSFAAFVTRSLPVTKAANDLDRLRIRLGGRARFDRGWHSTWHTTESNVQDG